MAEVLPRVFSMREIMIIYGQQRKVIYKMIERGQLKLVPGSNPMRIYDPNWSAAVGHTMITINDAYILKGIEVAKLLGVTPRRVRMYCEEDRLEYKDIGRGKRIQEGKVGYRRYSMNGVMKLMEELEKRRRTAGARPWMMKLAEQTLALRGLRAKSNYSGSGENSSLP